MVLFIYLLCTVQHMYNAVYRSMYLPVCSAVCNAVCNAVCSMDSVMVGHKGDTLTQPAILLCAICTVCVICSVQFLMDNGQCVLCAACIVQCAVCSVQCSAVMEGHKGDTLARPRISHSHEYTIAPTFHPDASHTKCHLFAISLCFATQEEALIIFDSNIRKTKQTSYISRCVSISTSQPSG